MIPVPTPTPTSPSPESSVIVEFGSSFGMNSGAPFTLLKVKSATVGLPATGASRVATQRSSVTPFPDSFAQFQYSSGPESTVGYGVANAPTMIASSYTAYVAPASTRGGRRSRRDRQPLGEMPEMTDVVRQGFATLRATTFAPVNGARWGGGPRRA